MESWAWPQIAGAIVSAAVGITSAWLGIRLRRRLGLPPTSLDQEIQDQELRLRQALKDAVARCEANLDEARGELDTERRLTARLRSDLDEEKLRTNRLADRILALERANANGS